jgi:hypothetical protein
VPDTRQTRLDSWDIHLITYILDAVHVVYITPGLSQQRPPPAIFDGVIQNIDSLMALASILMHPVFLVIDLRECLQPFHNFILLLLSIKGWTPFLALVGAFFHTAGWTLASGGTGDGLSLLVYWCLQEKRPS